MSDPVSPKSLEIEGYKEKIYRLELKLKSCRDEHVTEVEFYKEEADSHLKTITQLEKVRADLTCQLKAVKSKFEECQADLMDKSQEVEELKVELEKQIKCNLKSSNIPIELPSNCKEVEIYKAANEELKAKIKNLEATLLSQTHAINTKDEEIKDYKRMTEELKESVQTIQSNDNKNLDDHRRGNSLFSELDSRRVRVEEELLRLRERVKTLQEDKMNLQIKLDKGDHKSSVILTQLQAVQKSQDNVNSEISKWHSEKLRVVDRLTQRLEKLRDEYQTKLIKISNNVDPTDFRLTEERDQLLLQNISLNKEILQLKRDIKCLQHFKVESETSQIIKSVHAGKGNTTTDSNLTKNDLMTTDPSQNCKQQ
ncbi:unnamed protein product [Allacma fusca]|uniref:Uncharacterized protein n=1 Tax=Allacma fusca TaxID=39272 RepID=A0A8J2J156_9HEXA|nr:unnamed protein product [Allacma fusca]